MRREGEVMADEVEVDAKSGTADWKQLGFRLRHVGMAVPALGPTTELLGGLLGYRVVSGPFHDPVQRVEVNFLTAGTSDVAEIELIAPASDDSPVRGLLGKGGASAYHLCFETANMEGALEHARVLGCMVVSGPVPAVAFGGRQIAWLYTPTRQLFELVEAEDTNRPVEIGGEEGST